MAMLGREIRNQARYHSLRILREVPGRRTLVFLHVATKHLRCVRWVPICKSNFSTMSRPSLRVERFQPGRGRKGAEEESLTHQSVTRCSSSPSKAFMSSFEISNPPTSAFAIRRSFFVLLGSGTKPCWIDHLGKLFQG